MLKNILMVGAGGMAGSVLRYLLYVRWGSAGFPYVTLLINIAGSFIIGLVVCYATKNESFGQWRLFLATGICGGFTTFSAFSLECVTLLQQNRNIAATMYACASVLFGVAAAFAGYSITR